MSQTPDGSNFARRYASWIERRRWWILVTSVVFAVVAGLTASQLSVFSDFSHLLPQDVRSVKDLRAIEARARVIGTAMVVVKSDDAAARRKAALMLRDKIRALPSTQVSSVTFDRKAERDYGWEHRWLFVDLADLEKVRDGIATEIRKAKLSANPAYIDLGDDDGVKAGPSATDDLRKRLKEAQAKENDPAELVSKDGKVQLLIVNTGYSSGDVEGDRALLEALRQLGDEAKLAVPGVDVGVAGNVPVSVAEHDAILNGMLFATAVTVVLVFLALIWFFRSALAIGALSWSLMVGTVATFAFTKLAIGHLNLATAFLSSIVIGNGINVGILVTARYIEELRAGRDGVDAMTAALQRTVAGTLAAALTASVAYASLMITVFRGFRHFGIIGGVGILLCWVSGYIVLPAALSVARRFGMRPHKEAPIGRWLARLLPKNLQMVAIVTIVMIVGAGVVTAQYIYDDPFENNFKNLRSYGKEIDVQNKWMHEVDVAFGQGLDAGFVIAVPDRADVLPLKAKLRAADVGVPARDKLFNDLKSLDDALPQDQDRKLAVLAEIRQQLTSKDIEQLFDDDKSGERPARSTAEGGAKSIDRQMAAELTPPADLRKLTDKDVPDAIAWPFIEVDNSRGKLIFATPGTGYEIWDARDTVRFSDKVRALDLPDAVHLGGVSFVFADVIEAVLRDGPRATLASILGAVFVVLLVVGRNRHAVVTIVCGVSGTLLMLACASFLGLKVNFLDFVALPITIGIGIEYAVNIATRERQEGAGKGREALATTGSAVFLCSYTTIVGYGSLLLSSNLGIRSFGLAAMLGELTCLVVAVVLAPALLYATAPEIRKNRHASV